MPTYDLATGKMLPETDPLEGASKVNENLLDPSLWKPVTEGTSEVNVAIATTALYVAIAAAIGAVLYKFITVKGVAKSPSDYGRKCMAFVVFVETVANLPRFFIYHDPVHLIVWLIGAVAIGFAGFIGGWVYGNYFRPHAGDEIKVSGKEDVTNETADQSSLTAETAPLAGDAPPVQARAAPPNTRNPAGWYYHADGTNHGAYSPQELRALAVRGTIAPETPVWRVGMKTWVPAKRIRGLFTPPDISVSEN